MRRVWYELFGRKPSKKKRKPHQEFLGEFPKRKWSTAVRAWAHYREKGYTDVTLRECSVTHELTRK